MDSDLAAFSWPIHLLHITSTRTSTHFIQMTQIGPSARAGGGKVGTGRQGKLSIRPLEDLLQVAILFASTRRGERCGFLNERARELTS